MSELEMIRESLPEPAKDFKVNLQRVLAESTLTEAQRWGVAISCAYASRKPDLARALIAEGKTDAAVVDDAKAAAALMGMNNVYYRFKHIIGKDTYAAFPANLRMTRIARPATNKPDFELFCLAVSAVNNCQACVQSHEKVCLEGGITPEQVHDAVRVAATIHAVAVAMEIGRLIALAKRVRT